MVEIILVRARSWVEWRMRRRVGGVVRYSVVSFGLTGIFEEFGRSYFCLWRDGLII